MKSVLLSTPSPAFFCAVALTKSRAMFFLLCVVCYCPRHVRRRRNGRGVTGRLFFAIGLTNRRSEPPEASGVIDGPYACAKYVEASWGCPPKGELAIIAAVSCASTSRAPSIGIVPVVGAAADA